MLEKKSKLAQGPIGLSRASVMRRPDMYNTTMRNKLHRLANLIDANLDEFNRQIRICQTYQTMTLCRLHSDCIDANVEEFKYVKLEESLA